MPPPKKRTSKQERIAEYSYTVLFEPAAEGDTLAKARDMAKDAIRAYLESLRKDGERMPADPRMLAQPVKEKIRVAIPA